MQNVARIVDNILDRTSRQSRLFMVDSIHSDSMLQGNKFVSTGQCPTELFLNADQINSACSQPCRCHRRVAQVAACGNPKRSEQNASVRHNQQCDLRPVHCQGPFAAVYCIPKRDFWDIRPRDQDVERIALEAPTAIFIKIILLLACLDPRLSAGQSSRCRDDYCLWKYRPGHTVQLHQDRHGELQERWKSKGNSISAAPGLCRAILHAVYGTAISSYAPTSTLWISAQLMAPAFLAPQAAILS
jgi:hypothetical protein